MIDESFEALIARAAEGLPEAADSSARSSDPAPEGPREAPSGDALEERVAAAVAEIEARVSAWVASRVHAAERRLELQSAALEAALGEEARRVRDEGGGVEEARAAIAASAKRALADLATALDAARSEVAETSVERALEALAQAEGRVRRQGDRMEQELQRALERDLADVMERRIGSEIEAVRARLDRLAEDSAVRLEREADARSSAAEARLAASVATELANARRFLEGHVRSTLATETASGLSQAERQLAGRIAGELEARALEGERRLHERISDDLEQRLARIEVELQGRAEATSATLMGDVRAEAATAVGEAREQVRAQVPEAVRGAVEEQTSALREELDAAARASIERATGEVAGELRARLQAEGSELQATMAELRQELSKRGIRRERARLEADLDRGLSASQAALDARAGELAAELERRSTEGLERGGHELAAELAAARSEIERTASAARTSIADAARRRVGEAVGEQLGRRTIELERRLAAMLDRGRDDADARLAAVVGAAEARIAGAERALEREERIRKRTAEAERESERRVRAAERRLVEVLAQIDRVSTEPAGSGPAGS